MKIMTFNTQHCLDYLNRKIDFSLMAKTIEGLNADIVGLNEMFDNSHLEDYDKQTGKIAKSTTLPYFFFAKAIDDAQGEYGNGIISRYPIVSAESIIIPDPSPKEYDGFYETRCVLKATLENGLTVLITHFGLNPDEQKNAVDTVLKHITDTKCILMGDFNVTPNDPIIAPIKSKMKDTAELFTEPKLSWPSDKPEKKIDYIFVSPDIEVLSADIPEIVASDHRPHIAEIKF
jgi:endonuclease/exonuclease/phosphatase family metal-dependent hydrolase